MIVNENLEKRNNETYQFGKCMAYCLVIASFVCLGQIKASILLLLPSLLAFLALVFYACNCGYTVAVLLFFLPWSPLLKLQIGQFSFYTFAMILAGLVYLYKNGFLLEKYQIVCPSLIIVISLIAKAIHGHSLSFSYLFFAAMLFLFPCIIKEVREKESFLALTVFFSIGIISAALSAQRVAVYPNILRFIRIDSYLSITRLSGYYGDPNFYSAHITACLSGVLMLLLSEKRRSRQVFLVLISVVLIYCGMLSASKSFVVVTAVLVFIWIPLLMEEGNRSSKFSLLFAFVCAGLLVLSSEAFTSLFRIIDERFAYASNISDLTTKRTDIWMSYLKEFVNNPMLTLIGEGYTNVTIDSWASHNTIIQLVYQFGLLGSPFLIKWMYCVQKSVFVFSERLKKRKTVLLMFSGVVLPWMALDILFFDEFFLLSAYATAGLIMKINQTRFNGQPEITENPQPKRQERI